MLQTSLQRLLLKQVRDFKELTAWSELEHSENPKFPWQDETKLIKPILLTFTSGPKAKSSRRNTSEGALGFSAYSVQRSLYT